MWIAMKFFNKLYHKIMFIHFVSISTRYRRPFCYSAHFGLQGEHIG